MLVKTTALIEGMGVNAARMRLNIERGLGLWASSRLLLALVESGMERDAAYRIVQRAALKAADEERPFRAVAEDDAEITSRLTHEALAASFDEEHLLRNVDAVIARLEWLTEGAHVRG
jgi:adenylosuccinate lyase